MSKRPNVMMIVQDHFRKEAMGLFNDLNTTPNLDELAKDAVTFNNCYCQNPVCVPSRISFLSGRYPHTKGFRTMHHLQDDEDLNLLREMKKNGYYVYFGGKNDCIRQDVPIDDYCDYRSNAFDEISEITGNYKIPDAMHHIIPKSDYNLIRKSSGYEEMYRGDLEDDRFYSFFIGENDSNNPYEYGYTKLEDIQVEDCLNFIENYNGDKPLFVYLPLLLPHPWYAATHDDYQAINHDKVVAPIRLTKQELSKKPSIFRGLVENYRLLEWSEDDLRKFKHTYYAMVHHIDTNIKKIVDCLKKNNLYDDTMITVFSDHGDYASDYGIVEINQNTFEDLLTNVPLVIKPPKNIPYNVHVSDELVELVDVFNTITEVCQVKVTEDNNSKSLVHLFTKDEKHRDYVISMGGRLKKENQAKDAGHPKEMIYYARTSLQNLIPEHTKATMLRTMDYKYVYRFYEDDEFYDLRLDKEERRNEINNPIYHDIIETMRHQMLDFYVETSDFVPNRRDERH